MNTAAKISLVFTDSSSFSRFVDFETSISHSGLYQLIASRLTERLHNSQVFREFGDRLVIVAEQAQTFRRMDIVEQASQILVNLPSKPYEAIGRYYQALCAHSFGRGDLERAEGLLQHAANNAPIKYRTRAIISLAASHRYRADNQSALELYCEAARLARRNKTHDPYATLGTQRMIAVITSEDGNHRDALALLESLFPLAHSMRWSDPHTYYDYMNSLAVELTEVGRLEEAENVSQIVLASPFAPAYPEWRETSNEIALRQRRPSRNTVSFHQTTAEAPARRGTSDGATEAENLLRLTTTVRQDSNAAIEPVPSRKPAPVVSIQDWKKSQPNRTGKTIEEILSALYNMTTEDLIPQIWGRLGDEDVDDDLLREVLLLLGYRGSGEHQIS
jgi:hypothetical protein